MPPPTQPETVLKQPGLTGRRWWIGCALVFAGSLFATVPTTGDIGLTWDEPSYRTSQVVSAQWWERLVQVRSRADLDALLSPDALLYYWPYARYGYNFHPPLAGQLNLLTHALFGGWMKDIPSRRLASVFEYSVTITLLFGFLARRYGAWVGGVAAGSLLLMPRVYGDGHIAGTDTPGLLLWAVASLAFWKGLHDPNARAWRVVVGVTLGLSFVEKMAAVAVLGPILFWLVVTRVPRVWTRPGGRATCVDAVVISTALLIPIALAFAEVRRLARLFLPPANADVFNLQPPANLPGAILLVPLAVWLFRRLAGRVWPNHPVWGGERPGLEIWSSILAFAPVVGWVGNPGWWRETLARMAHYYQLSADRRGALPDIRIAYFGEIYNYSLPWHNAWVLIAITVPVGILLASIIGLYAIFGMFLRIRDGLPIYFAFQLIFLPTLRMLPTPAHDGVRLFLPTFFFLAAFAGWGAVSFADRVSRGLGRMLICRGVVVGLILGSASVQLVQIHPFELSYYNELIGGPRGAWRRGFELSYWYEAFDDQTLADLNRDLPHGAAIDFLNELINTPTFACLQELGALRGDIVLGSPDPNRFPHAWILTHDSKATPLTRLLFMMEPLYSRSPRQLGGLRVVTVDSPETVARAWALDILTRGPAEPRTPPTQAPAWLRSSALLRPLARFWGEGLTPGPPLAVDPSILAWARTDPSGLVDAAKAVAARPGVGEPQTNPTAARLRRFMDRRVGDKPDDRLDWRSTILLKVRPQALVEAARILATHPDALEVVLLRPTYSDPDSIGGPLDRGVAP